MGLDKLYPGNGPGSALANHSTSNGKHNKQAAVEEKKSTCSDRDASGVKQHGIYDESASSDSEVEGELT